jgi:hypothetical protein
MIHPSLRIAVFSAKLEQASNENNFDEPPESGVGPQPDYRDGPLSGDLLGLI